MFITNYKKIALTSLRKDALEIMKAGIDAVLPETVLKNKLRLKKNVLLVDGRKVDLSRYKNIYVVGGGKAAYRTAKFVEGLLENRITDGVVIDVKKGRLKKIKTYEGTHPYPSEKNVTATKALISVLKKAKKDDLVLAVVSGGGSSLLCAPFKTTCAKIKAITKEFFEKGANIREMNIVRKHISGIHGGNLAKIAYPADVLGLIFSDVPFRDISLVSSGPTFRDKTTKTDAQKIANKYGIKRFAFLETPKEVKYFRNVKNVLVSSNNDALKAMKEEAERRGYKTRVYGGYLKGEAKKLAQKLIGELGKAKGKVAIIGGGETVVRVRHKRKGGRNLETAMGAISDIPKNAVIVSMASDGKDNIDGVGGGLVDEAIIKKAERLKYSYQKFLEGNDSFRFMKDTGGLIETKRTGTNVSDLVAILRL
ncbi:MAG: DUF4147 domain-containing protein [Parcubacteria group bacterium]